MRLPCRQYVPPSNDLTFYYKLSSSGGWLAKPEGVFFSSLLSIRTASNIYRGKDKIIHLYGEIMNTNTYIAIDFETADYQADSACAIGLVKIQDNVIVDDFYSLICPPRPKVYFTHVHGLRWNDLKHAPSFVEIYPKIAEFSQGAQGFIAHNASFDRKVLKTCCTSFACPLEQEKFYCTLKASRKLLNLPKNSLSSVCEALNIELMHHHALSDALACAKVFLHFKEHNSDMNSFTLK